MQKDLAATLRRIAEQGSRGFYEAARADPSSKRCSGGGLITRLRISRVTGRLCVGRCMAAIGGYDIYSMSPPSSGGAYIVQILNILEGFPVASTGHNSGRPFI